MEAKKLRIGNLVHPLRNNGGITLPQTLIVLEMISLDYPKSKVCPITDNILELPKTPEFETNMLSPIPLNRAWFQKFGFHESNGFWIDLTTHYLEMISTIEDNGISYYYPAYVEVGELSSTPEQRVSLNRIRYVHELQNLFFALTGRELELVAEAST